MADEIVKEIEAIALTDADVCVSVEEMKRQGRKLADMLSCHLEIGDTLSKTGNMVYYIRVWYVEHEPDNEQHHGYDIIVAKNATLSFLGERLRELEKWMLVKKGELRKRAQEQAMKLLAKKNSEVERSEEDGGTSEFLPDD